MLLHRLRAKALFRAKERVPTRIGTWRRTLLRSQGARIGSTIFPHAVHATWPHRLYIGDQRSLERGIALKVDGIDKPELAVVIGNRYFIGAYVEFNINGSVTDGDDCLGLSAH